jgi:hypothetical protein
MRNISFSLTKDQFRARTKTETRRLGWWFLKPGEELMGCEKCQGLKPGEPIVRMGVIRVTEMVRERLDAITPEAVAREGFPDMTPDEFVAMFCRHMKVDPSKIVTVIRFEYVAVEQPR